MDNRKMIYADGRHDDTAGFQAFEDGEEVIDARTGQPFDPKSGGTYWCAGTLVLRRANSRLSELVCHDSGFHSVIVVD